MRSRNLNIIMMVIMIISILLTATACSGAKFIAVGDEAPNFKLCTPSGDNKSLSDYKGSNVLLIFEQIPCANCDAQRIFIQDAINSCNYEISVVSIYCENSPATVAKDVEEKNLAGFGTALVDPEAEVGALYGCGKAYPYNMLINSDGVIKAVKIGPFTSSDEFTAWLQSLQ